MFLRAKSDGSGIPPDTPKQLPEAAGVRMATLRPHCAQRGGGLRAKRDGMNTRRDTTDGGPAGHVHVHVQGGVRVRCSVQRRRPSRFTKGQFRVTSTHGQGPGVAGAWSLRSWFNGCLGCGVLLGRVRTTDVLRLRGARLRLYWVWRWVRGIKVLAKSQGRESQGKNESEIGMRGIWTRLSLCWHQGSPMQMKIFPPILHVDFFCHSIVHVTGRR